MGEAQTARRRGEQRSMGAQGQSKWRQKTLTCRRGVKEHSGGMSRGMAGQMEREKRRGRRKGRIICDSVLLKPLAVY